MPDGTGGGGEGSGNQYGGGDRNGGNNGNFNSDQATRDAINAADSAPASAAPAAPSGEERGAFMPTPPTPLGAERGAYQPTNYGPAALQAAYNQRMEDARQALPDSDRGAFLPTDVTKDPVLFGQIMKDLMGKTTDQKIKLGAGKNNPEGREVTVSVPENNPVDILGRNLSYSEAKAFQQAGLGNVVGVNANNMYGTNIPVLGSMDTLVTNNPGQTADSIVASKDAADFVGKVWDIAKNFIPGYGLIQAAADLASGKTTLGNLIVGIGVSKFAPSLNMSPRDVVSLANGQLGDLFTGQLAKYAISDVTKTYGPTAGLAAVIGLGETGATSGLGKLLSPANMNFNTTGKVADAFNTGLRDMGVTMGTGSGKAPTAPSYVGTSQQDAIDRYISNGVSSGSSSAPSSAPSAAPATPSSPLSSAGTSSGSYAGALSSMPTLGSTSGLYRVGNTNYTPYSQDLGQLNLAADEFTKQSDIGNIPVYNTDIAKMASSPFTQANDPYSQYSQYAAAGGSIRHFDEGGDVAPAPTADQLEKRAALQAQAEYYKNLDAEKQNADIMSALKNLSGVGAAEAKPQSSPLIRLGQVGQYTPPKVLPQLAALLQSRGMRLAEGGQPDDHKHPNYDGTPVFRTGGLSGLGGKYVEGKGDGTSDDITAMLADGEYVFSADVVSALGNGSNKAGAKALDETVQAIRARARSAPPDKLSPDAKSPLEYMQSVKGKKYG